jgi:hypothetical protein
MHLLAKNIKSANKALHLTAIRSIVAGELCRYWKDMGAGNLFAIISRNMGSSNLFAISVHGRLGRNSFLVMKNKLPVPITFLFYFVRILLISFLHYVI